MSYERGRKQKGRSEEKEFEQRSCKWDREEEGKGVWGGVMRRSLKWYVVCVTQFELMVPDSLWGCLRRSLKPFLILLLNVQFSDPSF